ncbi:MAG: hypothetical protein NZ524_02890 [Thiobacillaceae bacterium]|nr:hypothetical protein [Thiobacillaceae bacterium]MDW8322618.1 hypothetical protein [Burkholderiales bacterium]
MEAHAPFREMVFHLYAERLAGLMQLVQEVAFRHLDERLAAWLVERGPHIDPSAPAPSPSRPPASNRGRSAPSGQRKNPLSISSVASR